MRRLVGVVQIKSPQEMNRFARLDVGYEQSLHAYRDCCAGSIDGESTHWLHHLHLEVSPLETHLDGHIATKYVHCISLIKLSCSL